MRVLVCSDIHANLEALEAVLKDAGPVDAVWCLGDVVGYGPNPNECVECVRDLPGVVCLAGNHDWAALGMLDLDTFNPEARQAILWSQEVLSPNSRAWLEDRPQTATPIESKYTLTHGSPRYPIWEYILDSGTAAANFAVMHTPVCFFGHSHVPGFFVERDGRAYWIAADNFGDEPDVGILVNEERFLINPGSIGQPRDGDPRASYLILDTETEAINYCRVAYPVEHTQSKMEAAGLPPRLIARLSYGW